MSVVYGFTGEYRFLSNFWFVDVELDGVVYRSTEHAYQAAKTFDVQERSLIQRLSRPADAKKYAQTIKIREDWDEVRWGIMYDLNCQKYSIPEFGDRLLETGNMYLEETNTWNDTYWGVYHGKGKNNLGKILMAIREDLRSIREDNLLDAMGR